MPKYESCAFGIYNMKEAFREFVKSVSYFYFEFKMTLELLKRVATSFSFHLNLLTLICRKWIPQDQSTRKMLERSDSIYSSNAMLENILYYIFFLKWTKIHKKLWILFQFSLSPRGPIIGTKFTISFHVR